MKLFDGPFIFVDHPASSIKQWVKMQWQVLQLINL